MNFTDWSGTPRLLNDLNSVRAVAASRDPESTWWSVADRTLIPYSPSIEVEYIAPPIPLRDFDYRANFAGYEPGDCLGYGPTPDAAVRDLIDAHAMRAETLHG